MPPEQLSLGGAVSCSWLRLYTDLPYCIKLRRLPEQTQLFYVWCLCLHKEGQLVNATAEDIAWRLRMDPVTVKDQLAILKTRVPGCAAESRPLLKADNTPTGWDDRQYASDSSTQRSKKRRATLQQRCSNGDATVQNRDRADTEADTEAEQNRVEQLPPPPFASTAFATAWRNWVAYRRQKKKPLTDLTIAKQWAALLPLGESKAIELIDKAILKGWQGLVFPDEETKPSNQETKGVEFRERLKAQRMA